MTCIRIPNGIICVATEHEIVDASGRTWLFEMGMFGPLIISKRRGSLSLTSPAYSNAYALEIKVFDALAKALGEAAK